MNVTSLILIRDEQDRLRKAKEEAETALKKLNERRTQLEFYIASLTTSISELGADIEALRRGRRA